MACGFGVRFWRRSMRRRYLPVPRGGSAAGRHGIPTYLNPYLLPSEAAVSTAGARDESTTRESQARCSEVAASAINNIRMQLIVIRPIVPWIVPRAPGRRLAWSVLGFCGTVGTNAGN